MIRQLLVEAPRDESGTEYIGSKHQHPSLQAASLRFKCLKGAMQKLEGQMV
jgi:hypothetical protein